MCCVAIERREGMVVEKRNRFSNTLINTTKTGVVINDCHLVDPTIGW